MFDTVGSLEHSGEGIDVCHVESLSEDSKYLSSPFSFLLKTTVDTHGLVGVIS